MDRKSKKVALFIPLFVFSSLIGLHGCSSFEDKGSSTGDYSLGDAVGEITDTSEDGILGFLQAGDYQSWTKQDSVSAGTGPHGAIRVFFNDTIVESLEAGDSTHPSGSILVKELYDDDLTTLLGYAVMLKTKSGTSGENWLFYEISSPYSSTTAYGLGDSSCVSCHSSGTDYVRSSLP